MYMFAKSCYKACFYFEISVSFATKFNIICVNIAEYETKIM